jgi:hypothetical protein
MTRRPRRAWPAPSPGAGGSPRGTSGRISDLVDPANITLTRKNDDALVFVVVEADLDMRYAARDGGAGAEFSWEGFDNGSPASGRRWAALDIVGRLFIHKSDDSSFVAERE